jgi:hypothetical protein
MRRFSTALLATGIFGFSLVMGAGVASACESDDECGVGEYCNPSTFSCMESDPGPKRCWDHNGDQVPCDDDDSSSDDSGGSTSDDSSDDTSKSSDDSSKSSDDTSSKDDSSTGSGGDSSKSDDDDDDDDSANDDDSGH